MAYLLAQAQVLPLVTPDTRTVRAFAVQEIDAARTRDDLTGVVAPGKFSGDLT